MMVSGKEVTLVNNISTPNHSDTKVAFLNQTPHAEEEFKHRKLEFNAMRGLGYYNAKMSMAYASKGLDEINGANSSEEPGIDAFIPTSDSMKAKFESVLSGIKVAEEKETSGINRIDIRITEDGVREKIKTTKGATNDPAVIVELSRSAKYASFHTV